MSEALDLAVIGGSGLYSFPGLDDTREVEIETPFGKPSAPIILGSYAGHRVAFLARHGLGHHIMPTEVPFQANIFALKSLGFSRILSINACGSLRQDYAPGHIVIPDQLVDNTRDRPRTFFGNGLVAHVGVADPFCPDLSSALAAAVQFTGATMHPEGGLIIIEGPRFSTRAESNIYRSWGMSLVGMTAAPEAFLAREAELCYSVMAHVTDYDVWHVSEEPVSVEMVIKTLNQNTNIALEAIRNLLHSLDYKRTCSCGDALSSAIITDPRFINPDSRKKLDILVSKYLK